MKYKELRQQIKDSQKETAGILKRVRSIRKPSAFAKASKELQQEYEKHGSWKEVYLKRDYREKHIAYCMFFNNTPYEKIETPREKNKPDFRNIKLFQEIWKSEIDVEVVCTDS
jgi:hypothetical protein